MYLSIKKTDKFKLQSLIILILYMDLLSNLITLKIYSKFQYYNSNINNNFNLFNIFWCGIKIYIRINFL